MRIALHHEDIKKLSYLITYTDERMARDKESFSLNRTVKRMRRINLPKVSCIARGRELDDVIMM